jgi:hypothetical protein
MGGVDFGEEDEEDKVEEAGWRGPGLEQHREGNKRTPSRGQDGQQTKQTPDSKMRMKLECELKVV